MSESRRWLHAGEVRHVFTHFALKLDVWRAEAPARARISSQCPNRMKTSSSADATSTPTGASGERRQASHAAAADAEDQAALAELVHRRRYTQRSLLLLLLSVFLMYLLLKSFLQNVLQYKCYRIHRRQFLFHLANQ